MPPNIGLKRNSISGGAAASSCFCNSAEREAWLILFPGGDVVAVRILEFEAAASGEREDGLYDRRDGPFRALERSLQIVHMKHHQRPAGARRPVGGETPAQAVVHEAGVAGAIVCEVPAEHGGVE